MIDLERAIGLGRTRQLEHEFSRAAVDSTEGMTERNLSARRTRTTTAERKDGESSKDRILWKDNSDRTAACQLRSIRLA